jgi:hypothetical protein
VAGVTLASVISLSRTGALGEIVAAAIASPRAIL